MQHLDPHTGDAPALIAIELMNAWNEHDVERVMSFYASDYVGVDVGQATPERRVCAATRDNICIKPGILASSVISVAVSEYLLLRRAVFAHST